MIRNVRTGAPTSMVLKSRIWFALIAVTFSLASPVSIHAQEALPDLSLEDLLEMDSGRVFGASLRTQPVTEAPSSVSFITAEDIARYGYRSLAEILNGVRGLYVTNDRNFSFLGARGFGKPGDYNSRVLLLINGHRVNDNIFGQAEIGPEFGLDPAMFERVEIIRGPGSALYGDSAVFAVVNVITKSGASLGRATIAADAGTLGTRMLRGSMGRRFSGGVDFAAMATYEGSEGNRRLYFPVFDTPATNNGIAENQDGERIGQFYTQLTAKYLTFTGAYGTRRRDVPTASFGTLFNEQTFPEQTTDRHTLADIEYARPWLSRGHLAVRTSFDRFTYDGTYPFAGDEEGLSTVVGRNSVVGSRWSVAGRITHPVPGRQTVTAGGEFIDNIDQTQQSRYVDPPASIFDLKRSSTQYALYAEDEVKVTSWLIANAGTRYDRYEQFDAITPRAGLIVTPSATQSFKYLYGRAFRAPNQYEQNTFYFGDAVQELRPETINTHELVWEHYANDWLRTSASTYWYDAHRLITLAADESTLLGTTYINEGHVQAKGLELEAQMRLPRGLEATTSYALQRAKDSETGSTLPNSPMHMTKLRINHQTPFKKSSVSMEIVSLSSRRTLAGNRVGPAVTPNLTVIVPVGRGLDFTGTIRNLLDQRYSDPAADSNPEDAIAQNGRTLRVGLRVKLPLY